MEKEEEGQYEKEQAELERKKIEKEQAGWENEDEEDDFDLEKEEKKWKKEEKEELKRRRFNEWIAGGFPSVEEQFRQKKEDEINFEIDWNRRHPPKPEEDEEEPEDFKDYTTLPYKKPDTGRAVRRRTKRGK
jgi:hypothetical protein